MSVLLCVKMDVDASDSNFDEKTTAAFPIEGAYRMLQLPTLQWKIWGVNPQKNKYVVFICLPPERLQKLMPSRPS